MTAIDGGIKSMRRKIMALLRWQTKRSAYQHQAWRSAAASDEREAKIGGIRRRNMAYQRHGGIKTGSKRRKRNSNIRRRIKRNDIAPSLVCSRIARAAPLLPRAGAARCAARASSRASRALSHCRTGEKLVSAGRGEKRTKTEAYRNGLNRAEDGASWLSLNGWRRRSGRSAAICFGLAAWRAWRYLRTAKYRHTGMDDEENIAKDAQPGVTRVGSLSRRTASQRHVA
jgi:hypothetical protein